MWIAEYGCLKGFAVEYTFTRRNTNTKAVYILFSISKNQLQWYIYKMRQHVLKGPFEVVCCKALQVSPQHSSTNNCESLYHLRYSCFYLKTITWVHTCFILYFNHQKTWRFFKRIHLVSYSANVGSLSRSSLLGTTIYALTNLAGNVSSKRDNEVIGTYLTNKKSSETNGSTFR